MGHTGYGLVCLAAAADKDLQQSFGEDAAAGEILVVGFQSVQSLAERCRQAAKLCLFLIGQIVKVEVEGAPALGVGINLVYDTVKACHENGGIGIVGIAGSVGIAKLKALVLGGFGVGGDADNGAAVCHGVADGDGSFKAGDKALVGVGGGISDGADGGCVLQKSTDEVQSGLAELSIAVFIKEYGLTVLHKEHMHVHTAAGGTCHGLGHKGGGHALGGGQILDYILGGHGGIGKLGHLAQLHLYLLLAAAAHLVVVVLDLDAPILHHKAHTASEVIVYIHGQAGMVAFLVAEDIALIVILGKAVPLGLTGVYLKAGAVGLGGKAHIVKNIKLVLRADNHLIGNAQLTHILAGALGNIAGVLVKGIIFGTGNDHDIAYHGKGGYLSELIDNSRVQHGDKHHVAGFHGGVAVVGAVKADTVLHGVLIESLYRDAEMTPSAVNIGQLEVNYLDVIIFAKLQNFIKCSSHFLYSLIK